MTRSDPLHSVAERAFADAHTILGRSPGLSGAHRTLNGLAAQLGRPMSVALVGRISSGKSTLANALLSDEVTPTGAEELTFNVNRLYHSEQETLLVTFRDGRVEQRDPSELRGLTVRDERQRQLLESIDHLAHGLPNAALKLYDLIDTPGLDSHFAADSENTLRMLGRSGADVTASTLEHAATADAVVLVFCRGLAAGDEELVADFQRAGLEAATPLTAIGALTKVELLWPQHPDPLIEGARVAERMMNAADGRAMLYDLQPVASKVDVAAATFTAPEFDDLVALSKMDVDLLQKRLRRGPYFRERDYDDLPVGPPARATLFDRFSGYGIHLACDLIRQGVADAATLRTELSAHSGMARFRDLLTSHFGNRADLIKLRHTIDQVQGLPARLAGALDPRERYALDGAAAVFGRLALDEHGFQELRVIRQHYNGELNFNSAEVVELLRITGEQGLDPAARLGLAPEATPTEISAAARARFTHWSAVAVDSIHGGATRRAAQILRRSYELLLLGGPR